MASAEFVEPPKKLRVFLIPYFATSHIIPISQVACLLAAHSTVEPTILITPANAILIRSSLPPSVHLLTYPFPSAELDLPPGAENIASVPSSAAWKFDKAVNVVQQTLDPIIRSNPPDAIIADFHYWWALLTAHELGIPGLTFSVMGTFSQLVFKSLSQVGADNDDPVTLPGLPGPTIVIPRSELPRHVQSAASDVEFDGIFQKIMETQSLRCGVVVNTFYQLEPQYCEQITASYQQESDYCELYRNTLRKRIYFVGPLAAASGGSATVPATENGQRCMRWLATQNPGTVVYVCFGSWCHFSPEQLRELALGLEASGKPFLWVVRGGGEEWLPEGWEGRVDGMLVRGWAPQVEILGHAAVGAFLTHCGWNSVMDAVAAGVAMLTWPLVFEQFINERLVVVVIGTGERVWGGERSTEEEGEKVVVPGEAIGRVVAAFMEGGGVVARRRAADYGVMARAAVAEGGSSEVDLKALISELMAAAAAGRGGSAGKK